MKPNPRTTNAPCPCGSGLVGLRTWMLEASQMGVCCKACQQPFAPRTYAEIRNEDAIRQTAARRKLEARRDEAFAGGEGELW